MQYHAMQSKTIQYMQYKEIPCNTLFKSFETSTGPMGFVFSSWMVPYGLQQCWMSRVFRCDALDTPQGYISNTKNIPQKWGHGNLGHLGQNGPFWGPQGSSEGPEGPDLVPTSPDWPALAGHMVTTHFDLVSGLSWAPGGPKRAPFGPKCPLALNFHGPILCGNFFLEI